MKTLALSVPTSFCPMLSSSPTTSHQPIFSIPLSLSNNKIRDDGAVALGQALEVNSSLHTI